MKELFKQLLIDFESFDIPHGITRAVSIPKMPPQMRKAITFIGMRRSGKTWILYQNIHDLLSQGVERQRIIYINFEDERLNELQAKDFQSLLDAYYELNPKYEKSENIFIHLDEIQVVEGWEKFVRRLLDSRQYSLYITGSSAKLLSKEIATELRGRSLSIEVFPLSFAEYLQYHAIDVDLQRIPSKKRAVLLHYMQTYLQKGGFPEVLGATDWLHREVLQNYIRVVLYRDVAERHAISNISLLEKWMVHCLQNPASHLSINKVYGHFKSLGLQVSKNSLYEWLEFFEDAYCLFSVKCFDLSERKSSLKTRKVYPVDPGLINAFAIHPNTKLSQSLETAVFCHLRAFSESIYYYMTEQNWEIDFLLQTAEGQLHLYQVSVSLKDTTTYEREVRALTQAMKELGLKNGIIITMEEEQELSTPEGIIFVMPIWKFLLSTV
jgi:predicted AAA+ superfamily ATPase